MCFKRYKNQSDSCEETDYANIHNYLVFIFYSESSIGVSIS